MKPTFALLLVLFPLPVHAQQIVETALPGSGRPLTVALPAPAPAPGAPVVVSLHYGGPVTPHYGRGLLEHVVAPGLDGLGAVMVAPDCPAKAWVEAACTRDVFDAIDFAVMRYGADASRVALVGYSKGGIGAWALSDAHPDRFAAVVVMAGRGTPPGWKDGAPAPAFVLHGEADELFPVEEVRATLDARAAADQDVRLTVLPAVTHYDTAAFVSPLREAAGWLRARLSR